MIRDWSETQHNGSSGTKREVDAAIARAASRRKQLVTLDDLDLCGLSRGAARRRCSTGSLHRLHPGVFCLHPPPHSQEQRMLAAVLACGPGTVVSDLSAAAQLRLTEQFPDEIHVTALNRSGRRLEGVVGHRRAIERFDVIDAFGIPCTTAARTIFDCARILEEEALEDLLMAADSKRTLNRRRLEELMKEHPGQPGVARLRSLTTAPVAETRSANERRMLRICRRAPVEEPEVNYPIRVGERRFIADFSWPALRLVVEADSWRWHGGRLASESDADRDQLLALAGWQVVRFTRNQIKHQPELVGNRLLALVSAPRLVPNETTRPV